MRLRARFAAVAAMSWVVAAMALGDGKPEPSGPLKAYKGPEGELIVMVEADAGEHMLVYCKNVGGDIEGKTLAYSFENLGNGRKDVYVTVKRGSKTYRSSILTARGNRWTFHRSTRAGSEEIDIVYSEKHSEQMKIEDVLAAYHSGGAR